MRFSWEPLFDYSQESLFWTSKKPLSKLKGVTFEAQRSNFRNSKGASFEAQRSSFSFLKKRCFAPYKIAAIDTKVQN